MSDGEPIAFRRPHQKKRSGEGPPVRTGTNQPQHNATSPPPATVASNRGAVATTPHASLGATSREFTSFVAFNRLELSDIFNVYGRRVAAGEWRDYAIDWGRECAVFSIFRRASEMPIYRVVKSPRLARKQGAYSVVSATGLVLKRGHDLRRVLDAIDKRLMVVK